MNTKALLSVAALVPGFFLMQTSATSSVAVIDFDRAIAETPAGQEALKKMNSFETEQRTAIAQKQKEVDDLQNRLRVQDRALTDAARTQMSHDLEEGRTALQTMGDAAQKKLEQMQDELLAPVEGKMAATVNAYAAERGVQIVLNSAVLQNGLIYVHDTADITTEIVRRMALNVPKPGSSDASLILRFDPKTSFEQMHEQFIHRKWGETLFLNDSRQERTPADRVETAANRN